MKAGDRVEITNNAISWLPPAHACWATVIKVTKAYVWVRNEHGCEDKYHVDGRPIGGGDYHMRPAQAAR